jgi:citrate lyase beta subunit
MRYFSRFSNEQQDNMFFWQPQPIDFNDKTLLMNALGATLYMPATRQTVVQDIIAGKLTGLTSMVLCLEDAIGDNEVAYAEQMAIAHVEEMAKAICQGAFLPSELPLIFVRVRSPKQMQRLIKLLGEKIAFLSGFVFPKFTAENGQEYLEVLADINKHQAKAIYGMPILESSDILYVEARYESLIKTKKLLDKYQDYILNVRLGATDFSGIFGLRRNPDLTIYDISLIGSCIADIVNVFSRPGGYVVSGPVWEFYASNRVLKPSLRETPFKEELGQSGNWLRSNLVLSGLDGLIREVILDKANGLVGKTIIHPSHILLVQALHVVTYEEYQDAQSILENADGTVGVIASKYANKMNEIKPHMRWAQRIMIRAKIFGVFREEHNFISLLSTEYKSDNTQAEGKYYRRSI